MSARNNLQIKTSLGKSWLLWGIVAALILLVLFLLSEREAPFVETGKPEQGIVLGSEAQLKDSIDNIVKEHDFANVQLDHISVMQMGEAPDIRYQVHIYFDFDINDTPEKGNQIMRRHSGVLLAALAKKRVTNIDEAAIIWNDNHNNRTVDFVYRYRNGRRQSRFSIVDVLEK
ncbi:hypothetical protein [Dethiobacter alkaliphilus]|uniref:hypothetical protein n=1 Tax=Dethiobacter alkaliphilus TaxID=427926 RepID=UPI00222731A7|nr:hypothetical protein [Dethiobacter alkaliphilus]MCW3488662.1 hypothetical protein [Dethiobacter alkaliphilus]